MLRWASTSVRSPYGSRREASWPDRLVAHIRRQDPGKCSGRSSLTAATLITSGAYAVEPIGGTHLGNPYFADDGTAVQRRGNALTYSNGKSCTSIRTHVLCD